MTGITEEEYGNYLIKAGQLSGVFMARAFPKPPIKTKGLVAEASGKSEDEAIAALKAMIDARDAERSANRRWEVRSGIAVPVESEFAEALRQTDLSGAQVAMLTAHAISGDEGLSGTALARAAGYKSKDTAEKIFKKAGALLATYIGADLGAADTPSGDGSARIMAYRERLQDELEEPVWVMHAEMRDAVRATL